MATESRILITVNTPQGQIKQMMEQEEFRRLQQDKEAFREFLQRHTEPTNKTVTKERCGPTESSSQASERSTGIMIRERSTDARERSTEVMERSTEAREGSTEARESSTGVMIRERSTEVRERSTRSEESSNSIDEPSQGFWAKGATQFLIEEYSTISKQVESGRMTKKSMWQLISRHLCEKGCDFSSDQVSGRWKSLIRAYKNTKDNNKRSGSGRKKFEYESQLDGIFQNDPSILPEMTLSSTGESDDQQSTGDAQPPKKQRRRISDVSNVAATMQNFIKEQEKYRKEESERKERMHKEKLETLKSLINVFTRSKRNKESDSDE